MSEEKARSPDLNLDELIEELESKLSKKELTFANEYLKDLNRTRAAIRTGYSQKSAKNQAYRMMTNDDLRTYIDARIKKMQTERVADAQEVIEFLSSVVRGEKKEQVLKYTSVGTQELVDVDVSIQQQISAAKELLKRYDLVDDLRAKELKERIRRLKLANDAIDSLNPEDQQIIITNVWGKQWGEGLTGEEIS